ncbi:hypothetical protein [Alloactinosynnema sp. L-07]|uniref:DUF6461 domain-containing protein n=1 Tax=Alloactinosynnema sp. L-07 TaxID=1653480 RepID=UPI00065F05A2|nr:DUF6461 domain-containing protein [Alloactinosynnema sp. L-07]CRK59148.1 hypothetical protein [Alloactinosynnema sp. L-07]
MRELRERHAWVDTDHDLAITLAVVVGSRADDVVRAYGGDPAAPIGARTFAESAVPVDDIGDYGHAQVFTVADRVVVLENNGWAGSDPDTAVRASTGGGSFLSAYWNVDALSRLVQAVDGKVTANLEPLFAANPPQVGDVYPEWLDGGAFTAATYRSACLAVVQQQTGVAFDRKWLETAWSTFRIPVR